MIQPITIIITIIIRIIIIIIIIIIINNNDNNNDMENINRTILMSPIHKVKRHANSS